MQISSEVLYMSKNTKQPAKLKMPEENIYM